jgi:hypothetical protein
MDLRYRMQFKEPVVIDHMPWCCDIRPWIAADRKLRALLPCPKN